jgi:RHS repeat-associated protein
VNGQWQVVARHDFMPFGEEIAPPSPPQDKRLFTGKERDSETGLDYFEARYLRGNSGRFTTVDPLMDQNRNLVEPQKWNRYAYVRNNPLKYVDPDGRAEVYIWTYRGKNTAWGHAALKLDDGTYISWWPQGENREPKLLLPMVYEVTARPDQTYEWDRLLEGQPPDQVIRLSGLDEKAILDWWVKFRKRENKWKTVSQNCSTVVVEAVKAGGADVSWTSTWDAHNLMWTPADVEKYAKAVKAYLEERERKKREEEEKRKKAQ